MRRYLLGVLFLILHTGVSFAQPANDDCDMATSIFQLDGTCLTYDNMMATPDIASGDCAPNPNIPNIWFSFVANGPDLTIDVSGEGNDVYVALIQFDPNPCEFASAGQLACGFGDGVEVINVNSLNVGETYYLIVNMADAAGTNAEGFFQMCLNNPTPVPPPANDDGCNPTTVLSNGTCITGTTEYATQEYTPFGGCDVVPNNGVFFEFTVTPGNLGVIVDVNNISLGGDIVLVVGQFNPDCNGIFEFSNIYCGPPGNDVLEVLGLVAGETYTVFIATETSDQGDFELCVTEFGPPPGCSENNFCTQAEDLGDIDSESTELTCVEGCNILASSETNLQGCNFGTQEVVWYSLNTDEDASLISVTVTSNNIDAPAVQIFSGSCNVNELMEVSDCFTGSNGEVSIVNNFVPANETIYIAVSNDFGDGGNFSLCLLVSEDPSSCLLDAELEVTNTSLGSPLGGPYQPGETVSYCYTINSYTSEIDVNGCQWLQGIVPIFGDGWDPASFNAVGMPIATSGVEQPSGYASIWGWYTDVTYNHNIIAPYALKSIGDFDGDGDIDICHYTELDCDTDIGVTAGQLMPPGWFAWTNNGMNATGHPNVDYGSGEGCTPNQGPWSVCFDLITLDFTSCDAEDPQITDTTVKIYTTSDGETGEYGGTSSTCADDIPTVLKTVLNCCIGPEVENLTDVVCPGGTTDITLTSDQTGNITYSWTVESNNNVSGYADGAGQFIAQNLDNNTNNSQIVNYVVTAISEEGCQGLPTIIPVTVLPAIEVDAGDPIDGCAQGVFNLGGDPTATGGDGTFTYNWGNAAINNVSNPNASPNISTVYTVTVTDGNGCTSTDDVELTINPRFEVDVAGDTLLCPDFPVSNFSGSPLGGSPNYSFDWAGTGIVNGNNQNVDFDGYGLPSGDYTITLTVTDNNGCTGDTEFNVDIFNDPQLFIATIPDGGKFCPGESIDVSAVAILGEPGVTYNYNWTTPSGDTKNGSNIVADETGYYVLELVDPIIMCSKTDSIFIEEIQPPEPEILSPLGICEGEMVYIKTDTTYSSVLWDNGMETDSILVGPGTYNVTVTNIAGCEGVDVITVNPFPSVTASIGGSSAFCEGSSSVLSVGDNFIDYEWTNSAGDIISIVDSVVVSEAGTYNVVVYDANGCSAVDDIMVEIQDFLVPNIIGDTSICPLACTELDAGSGYSQYEWSTNETTQTISVCNPGDYTVTVYDAGGCTGEEVKIVTENDLPTPQILGENNLTSFCPGDDLVLDAGSGYNNYFWEGGAANQTITVDTAGTYIVTVTDAEGCESSAEIEITENTPPTPSFTGDLQFCPGDSVEITPDAGYMLYEIDTDNNGSVDISSSTNESFYISTPGNSNIIVTDMNGCEGEVIVTTSLFTPPTPETSIDTASYCTDGSVFISLTQDYANIEWFFNNTNVGSGQSIEVNQEGTYEAIVEDINGCTAITNMEVVESTELFPSITGETSMCDSSAIDLNAGNGYDTYDWGSDGDSQIITVNEPGMYQVTVFDAGGCSGVTSVTITNSSTPEATVPEEMFICNNNNGENTSISVFSNIVLGAQGFWEDTNGTGVDLTDLNNVDFVDVAPGIYEFIYTTSIAIPPCEDQMYSMTVEVSECLCPSLELGTVEPLCTESASINLADYTITNESGFWNVEQGNGNVLNGSFFDPTQATEGTYVLSYNLDAPAENCDSVRTLEIQIIAPPNPGVFDQPAVICFAADETITLADLLTGEEAGGQWVETSPVSSTGNAFNDANGTFETVDQSLGSYTFRYNLTGQAPCSDASAEVTVVIEDLPVAIAGGDKMLNCDLPEVEIGTNSSQGEGIVYQWTESKGIPIENSTSPIVTVEEEGQYYLKVVDVNSCEDRDTAVVTRNTNFPDISIEGADPFCTGENTGNIVATGLGGEGPYQYSIDNGNTWLDDNAFMNLTAGTYNVMVQDQNSCTDETTISISDPSPFTADLGADFTVINQEDSLITLDISTGMEDLEAAIWTVNDSIVCEGANCLSYLVNLETDKEVCVSILSTNGCADSTCINIRSVQVNDVYSGNVITPNDDGINDVFYIQGGKNLISVDNFKVFNRWGEEIFSVENFPPNDKSYGWTGKYKGASVNPGVYVYSAVVVFDDGDVRQINGDITVVK